MSKPHVHLTAVASAGSFTDCILFCRQGLEGLGYSTSSDPGVVSLNALNILFCTQMMTWSELSANASQIILYNWEPVAPDIGRFPATYLRQMQSTHVWDYNEQNIQKLRAAGVQDIHYVPMGYSPQMQRVVNVDEQDIDVLFYGYINQRRAQVLDAIRAKGLRVLTSDDVGHMSDTVRDGYIARAKVVLNMHFFEQAHVFEVARVAYLLANKKAVVTELSVRTHIEDDLRTAVLGGELGELPQLCWDLVHDDARRRELENKAFDVFSKRNATEIMRVAMNRYTEQSTSQDLRLGNNPEFSAPIPEVLQLAAAYVWRYDYCNIDARKDYAPDLHIDIEKPLPLGDYIESWRFGRVKIRQEMFKRIVAHDIFVRVKDLRTALSNCLLLLEDGGEIAINVPLDMSQESWSKFNYKRAFNDKTWGRILEAWWQYGWTTHTFEVASVGSGIYQHNPYGYGVIDAQGGDWGKAMRVPRAVDLQQLVLRKRKLTDDELKLIPQARFMD